MIQYRARLAAPAMYSGSQYVHMRLKQVVLCEMSIATPAAFAAFASPPSPPNLGVSTRTRGSPCLPGLLLSDEMSDDTSTRVPSSNVPGFESGRLAIMPGQERGRAPAVLIRGRWIEPNRSNTSCRAILGHGANWVRRCWCSPR